MDCNRKRRRQEPEMSVVHPDHQKDARSQRLQARNDRKASVSNAVLTPVAPVAPVATAAVVHAAVLEPQESKVSTSDEWETWFNFVKKIAQSKTIGNKLIIIKLVGFFFEQWPEGCLLTLQQATETLAATKLVEADNTYHWKNLVTAACDQPWKLPVSLVKSGSCYFGNFGQEPYSDDHAKRILQSNSKTIRSRDPWFFGY